MINTSDLVTEIMIPDFFSFSIDPSVNNDQNLIAEIKKFKSMQTFFNDLAGNRKINNFSILVQNNRDLLIQSNDICSSLQSTEAKKHHIRVNLALYVLYGYVKFGDNINTYQRDLYLNQAKELIQNLTDTDKTEEMHWYYALLLYSNAHNTKNFDLELVYKTIECLKHIQRPEHREALGFNIVKKFYPCLDEYPTDEIFQHLQQALPNVRWNLEVEWLKLRHEFIKKSVINKEYMGENYSKNMHLLETNSTITANKFDLQINMPKDLFKFAAHICSPSPPMFKVGIDALKKYGWQEKFTEEFSIIQFKTLVEQGFCDREEFLNVKHVKDNSGQFKNIIITELFNFIDNKKLPVYKNHTEKQQYRKMCEESLSLDKISVELDNIENRRKTLEGFNPRSALFLFHAALISHCHGLKDTALIKNLVQESLQISILAKNASILAHTQKHDEWFNIATKLVKSLQQNPRTLLIQCGTPIRKDEKASTHAFYVTIKSLESNTFQIIMTNGGRNAEKLHILSPTQHSSNYPEYCYAACNPFIFNNDNQEALINYIYLLISLQYRHGVQSDEENKNNQHTYMNLLKNVYMQYDGNTVWPGYKTYNLHNKFARIDLEQVFSGQFTGNCTIHNLKHSLKIVFDMNKLEFGLLEDTLLLGLDKIISNPEILTNLNQANNNTTSEYLDSLMGSSLEQSVNVETSSLIQNRASTTNSKNINCMNWLWQQCCKKQRNNTTNISSSHNNIAHIEQPTLGNYACFLPSTSSIKNAATQASNFLLFCFKNQQINILQQLAMPICSQGGTMRMR